MNLPVFLWCGLIVILVFYMKFVLESADEKEAMTVMFEKQTNPLDIGHSSDRIDVIQNRMKEFERECERLAAIKKAGIRAAELSHKWSPTVFLWNAVFSMRNAILL